MRVLLVDHYYEAVVRSIYDRHPGLADRSYAEQRVAIDDVLFGQTVFEVAALRELGHEAWDSLVNIRPLQQAWAREHGARLSGAIHWGLKRRRGWIPWPGRQDNRWMMEALLAQVRELQPDVVHVQSMDLLHPEEIRRLKGETRLVVGQIAADLPSGWGYGSYDLIVSSVPALVDRFRRETGDAELLPLAFEPSLADRFRSGSRDIPVSFVGSFSVSHPQRIEVLEAVARSSPLRIWTGDATVLPANSSLRAGLMGAAWGRDMYEILARSRITVNNHARVAAGSANNLRLFEATGLGALLVTDAAANLADLFEPGREVAAYKTPKEAAEVVHHFLRHPAEAEAIARAGQERTLREHTWRQRMERLVAIISDRT